MNQPATDALPQEIVDEPPRPWHVSDDMGLLQAVIDRLEARWTAEQDRVAMRQFFRQKANEV